MNLIQREMYLSRLKNLQGTPDIKIITGIRRSGKSKLMESFINYVKKNDKKANIIFIDLTNIKYENLKEYHSLNDYVESKFIKNKNNYLFIDEVQLCNKFELTINSFYSSEKYDIYLTGSNAFLLSADLATLFTGRFIEIQVFPFSFNEYCEYHSKINKEDVKSDVQKYFDSYVIQGGLSGSYSYKTELDKKAYIKDVYTTILNRDLIQKYNLANENILEHLAEYLMDNISNITSPNNVSSILNKNNLETSHVTVNRYLKYLCNAFIFYDIKRYEIRGGKYLNSLDKFYLCDTGIRYAILGKRNMDYGRAYENIVCIELLRRGYSVYIGKLYEKEIDFVAMKESEKIYIQVSDDISNENTFKREYEPLLKIADAYPKIIIARTRHEEYDFQGIKIVDIAYWLLNYK